MLYDASLQYNFSYFHDYFRYSISCRVAPIIFKLFFSVQPESSNLPINFIRRSMSELYDCCQMQLRTKLVCHKTQPEWQPMHVIVVFPSAIRRMSYVNVNDAHWLLALPLTAKTIIINKTQDVTVCDSLFLTSICV